MPAIRNNTNASAPPQVTDDSSRGYAPGSLWAWEGRLYVCRSAAVGAAAWVPYMVGDEPWNSNTYRYPANVSGQFVDVTPSTSADLLGFFPFIVTRPIKSVAFSVSAAGSANAAAACGIYAHDPLTGRPAARLASFGTVSLTSTGIRGGGNLAFDLVGLLWISVHVKLTGLTTAPTYVCMAGANGRFVNRGDGSDLAAKSLLQMYSSVDAYSASPPSVAPALSAINRNVPCPILLAA